MFLRLNQTRTVSHGLLAAWVLLLPTLFARGEETQLPGPRFLLKWGQKGQKPGEFHFPIGIAIERDHNVLITDFYNERVQRFSPEGQLLAAFPVLPNPGGIAVDQAGNFYLTHFTAMKVKEEKKPDRVSVYRPDGRFVREWGKTGTGDGEFDYPGGIAISRDGRVYVADQTNRRVQVFDSQGKFLLKWGEYGTKEGQFGGKVTPKSRVGGPQFLAFDSEGYLYTTEGSMNRVQKFTADGKFVFSWTKDQTGPGGLAGSFLHNHGGSIHGPVGICVDSADRLWISAVNGRIQQFTRDGKYLQGIGDEQGDEPGQFVAPHGVAVNGRNTLYIVDSYNHRIQKFAVAP